MSGKGYAIPANPNLLNDDTVEELMVPTLPVLLAVPPALVQLLPSQLATFISVYNQLGKLTLLESQFIDTIAVPPENVWMQTGGKEGMHTEQLGYILADMQFMQRAYPGLEW